MINKERLIALIQKTINFNSENPPGNELALSEFIAEDMRSLGLQVKKYSYAKGRPNIIATLKGSLPGKKAQNNAILISPHIDTVPIGKNWKFDPLGGQLHKGRIYGRGASDDKSGLACCMEVMRSIVEDKIEFKGDIIMAATVDEETGSHHGIIPLLENNILKPAAAVIVDSEESETIIAQKGLIHCRVKIFGKKAHGAYNWLGISAIERAANVIIKLKKHKFIFKAHPLLKSPTINVGVIKGGDKVNMVSDFCEFALDIRFLPGMSSRNIISEIRKIIKSEVKNFKIEIDALQQPYEIDEKHPLVKAFMSSAKEFGFNAPLTGSEGATVITFFKKYKIPAFATGFGSRGTAHTTDEYVSVKNLYNGARLLERFLINYDNKMYDHYI